MQPCNLATLQPCNIPGHKTQCSHYDSYGIYYDVTLLTVLLFYSMFLSDFVQTLHLFSVGFDVLLLHSSYFPHFLTFYCWILLSFIWFCATCVGTLSLIRCARVLVLPPHTVCYAPHQIKPRQRFSTGKQRGEDNIPTERDENRPERDGGKQYSHGRGRKGIRNCKTN